MTLVPLHSSRHLFPGCFAYLCVCTSPKTVNVLSFRRWHRSATSHNVKSDTQKPRRRQNDNDTEGNLKEKREYKNHLIPSLHLLTKPCCLFKMDTKAIVVGCQRPLLSCPAPHLCPIRFSFNVSRDTIRAHTYCSSLPRGFLSLSIVSPQAAIRWTKKMAAFLPPTRPAAWLRSRDELTRRTCLAGRIRAKRPFHLACCSKKSILGRRSTTNNARTILFVGLRRPNVGHC